MIETTVDISPYDPTKIAVWSDYRLKESVKAVPGAKWDGDNRIWTVPLSWPSCLALRAELGQGLKIEPGLAGWAYDERSTKQRLGQLRSDLLLSPDPHPTFLEACFEGCYPHQLSGALAVSVAGQYALFDETGAGKGRTALGGLRLIEQTGDDIFPVLIIAPKSMLITWARDEIPRFFPTATISVVTGTPSKIRDALEPGADFYVCSYDTARRYSRHTHYPTVKLTDEERTEKELNRLGCKTVVVDEAHRIKNPAAKQTRAVWMLGSRAEYRLALTGSPVQDTSEDLWSVLHFLSPEEYPTKTSYVERFLMVEYNIWGGREIKGLNPLHEAEFRANAETRYRRVTKEVALPFLPRKIPQTRWVELPPRQRKAYDEMKKTLVAELEAGVYLEANSTLEAATRLVQLANAGGDKDADGRFWMQLPSPKIEAFLEDLGDGDFEGQQVVVFSDSRQLIELLSGGMDRKKIGHTMIHGDITGDDRQKAIDKFQNGEVQYILITRAGGEGITLTAASIMVRLTRPWSYIVHTQAEDRVHRIGSEIHESILYLDYVTQDTIEVNVLARLHAKKERATEVLGDEELLVMLK